MASCIWHRNWTVVGVYEGPNANFQAYHDSYSGEPDLCFHVDTEAEAIEEIDRIEDEALEGALCADLQSSLVGFVWSLSDEPVSIRIDAAEKMMGLRS